MQFLCICGAVECPACGTYLKLLSEQDARVASMKHEGINTCCLHNKTFRVDRRSGYGEPIYEA